MGNMEKNGKQLDDELERGMEMVQEEGVRKETGAGEKTNF